MYDSIVVGAGHAGIEAAYIQAKQNLKVLLITLDLSKAGSMPCNPSIGGPAKGIVVREIDALGGIMGVASDYNKIQHKILNPSKGPAVRALRFQIDKESYKEFMLNTLSSLDNLTLLEDSVEDLIVENNICLGVKTKSNSYYAKTVILTTGTYLKSLCLKGHNKEISGPDGEKTNLTLSENLKKYGFTIVRLKTGTPARILTSSIDFSKTQIEPGTELDLRFSHTKVIEPKFNLNLPCYLTYTTKELHDFILENKEKSAMYSGNVVGIGPRYCPSIEDKIVRFKDKERHQIFLEPESLQLDTTYVQGLSTSFNEDLQEKIYRLVPGLENCVFKKYAYAIEYDAISSLDLYPTMETKFIANLYTAGQINGTSGYEEAAAQGLIAGINSLAKIKGLEPLILKRNEAYIGVMIDDLVTKGVVDPYRLLTSRAEFRLLLRHDNADLRLRHIAYKYNLIDNETYKNFLQKEKLILDYSELFKTIKVKPSQINHLVSDLKEAKSLYELLKRPEITYKDLEVFFKDYIINFKYIDEVLEQLEINYKYEGYILKMNQEVKKQSYYQNIKLDPNFNYYLVPNLALEAKEKLMKIKPLSILQAQNISGVNPVDITALILYLEAKKRE